MAKFVKSVTATALGYLSYLYIRFVCHTNRWEVIDTTDIITRLHTRQPIIVAFWHGRMVAIPNFSTCPDNIYVMVSRHSDGDFIARIIRYFGLKLIRGSTNRKKSATKGFKNRGGMRAFRAAFEHLRNGHSVAITPDGPKGPRMVVRTSIASIASKAGVPVYPVTYSSGWGLVLGTWDKFLFPFPFGRSVLICGRPIHVCRDANKEVLEQARLAIQTELTSITRQADLLVGRTPVNPEWSC